MTKQTENPIPKGPPDLCFDSNAFTKEPFSVDHFLQDHSNKANLETMRNDLGTYLKVLSSAMIELINKDYADFVNLSCNLIGLDKAINSIQTPLGQLREELLQVRQSLEEAMLEVTEQLNFKREIRDQKRSLKSLVRIQTAFKKLKILLAPAESGQSLDILVLERAVAEYNHLQFNITRCQNHLSDNDKAMFERVGSALVHSIDKLFLDSVTKGEKGRSGLTSSLLFYLMLGKRDEAERLYRKSVVSTAMRTLINEETLRSLPRGLPGLYDKILLFLDKDMKHLREVTQEADKYPGINSFDFFIRSFWPEVEENLENNLASIYAAGDPDMFYQRYCETQTFIEELGKRCNSETAVKELYNHPNFNNFLEKWDLPVYFQIRFQEIVKSIENSFANEECLNKSGSWKLVATETVWASLNKCWEPGVFLLPIAHKFWRLSLQIISRYQTWIEQVINKKSGPKGNSSLDFLVYLYSDIELFISSLGEFETKAKAKLPGISEKTSQLLNQSLEESVVELQKKLGSVSSGLIQRLGGESNTILRQVSDIPRLFRRTNREAPTKACTYVTVLLDAPSTFHKKHQSHPQIITWLQAVFSDVTKQYYSSVAEVLTSVQKTEESLRRLKKARDRTTNIVPPNDRRAGDDDKIRLQILLDVQAYMKGVEDLGVKRNDVERLNDLLTLVENTQKP